MRLRGVLLMVGLVAGSAAACTLWVDNQFKGYSGTCQLPNANDNVCGQCGTQECGPLIDKTCTVGGVTDQLNRCFTNPSYGGSNTWGCSEILDDAAVNNPMQSADESALRHCVNDHCFDKCTTCTDFDAGVGPCGDCLRSYCASVLNGTTGCCDIDPINAGMAACGSSVNHSCAAFLEYEAGEGDAAPPMWDTENWCMNQFSLCVQNSCGPQCQ
jgi:hypothetical protein